jgi:hypothetical protein
VFERLDRRAQAGLDDIHPGCGPSEVQFPRDLLVVPPGAPHAFAAHHDSTAEALIIATPGIERFDYFRHVVRRREGSEPPEVLLGLQDRFDTHFLDSPVWQRARAAA